MLATVGEYIEARKARKAQDREKKAELGTAQAMKFRVVWFICSRWDLSMYETLLEPLVHLEEAFQS
jgi:hypothetical protein